MTRKLLASFLEYAATGKTNSDEIRRFCNSSDADPMMADAIRQLRELVPYPYWLDGSGVAHPNADRIFEIARKLREADTED